VATQIREYPKGRRQHVNGIPQEIRERLVAAKLEAKSEFVVTSRLGTMVPYRWYLAQLRKYCRKLELPVIGTHGLRHSTSELYLSHGASRDDIRQLFAHSSLAVTERYIHQRGTNLEKVTNVIRLFPAGIDHKSTTVEGSEQSVEKGG
jgi:integrase